MELYQIRISNIRKFVDKLVQEGNTSLARLRKWHACRSRYVFENISNTRNECQAALLLAIYKTRIKGSSHKFLETLLQLQNNENERKLILIDLHNWSKNVWLILSGDDTGLIYTTAYENENVFSNCMQLNLFDAFLFYYSIIFYSIAQFI